jgi:ATP-dependent helicase/DNAse subunit B
VSLYAEVLTFTGLARWVDRQLGSGEPVTLDKGGQLLCMALAVDMVYSQLRVYGGARKRAAMQNQLLDAVTELKGKLAKP